MPYSATKRRRLSAGSSGREPSHLLDPGRGHDQRGQVGLGEVAVVVGLLLRAHRDRLAAVAFQRRVSWTTPPPDSRTAAWRAISCSMARATLRKEFRFLISARVPKASLPEGGSTRSRRSGATLPPCCSRRRRRRGGRPSRPTGTRGPRRRCAGRGARRSR